MPADRHSLPLDGRRALVTGASRGLGKAIAIALARAGADVALACRINRDLASGVADHIHRLGRRASIHLCDLGQAGSPAALVAEAVAALGGLEILVGNAAENLDSPVLRTSEAAWDRIMAVNLGANAALCRAAAPHLVHSRGAHIVFISSYVGLRGNSGQAAYGASKAGLIGLCRSLARELGPQGVCVNVILPGYLDTDMGRAAGDSAMANARATSLLGALGDVDETARLIVALCAGAKTTGQVINCESRPALGW